MYNENKVEKILAWLKENKLTIGIILTFFSFVSLMLTLNGLREESANMSGAVQNWYEQLPEEHWLKDEENDPFGTRNLEANLFDLIHTGVSGAKSLLDLAVIGLEEEGGPISQLLGKSMEHQDGKRKNKYILRYSDTNKKVKTIKVGIGEETNVTFYYDDIELLLDFTEEDYQNEIARTLKSTTFSIATRIVYSYVDDPTIATIYNGKIVGLQRGRTTLNLYCNGYHFTYTIKVK